MPISQYRARITTAENFHALLRYNLFQSLQLISSQLTQGINERIIDLIEICDMIKRNHESDVGNIDFELQAKIGHKC